MRRLFYLSVGAAVGVYASRRVTRAVQAWTPAGVADSAAGLGASLRELAGDVRVRAADREAELRAALDLGAPPATDRRGANDPAGRRRPPGREH